MVDASNVVTDKRNGELDWLEVNKWVRHGQAIKRKASKSQDFAKIQIATDVPIVLATLSDTHMGSWGADHDMLEAFTENIVNTEHLHLCLLGDMLQMSIKLRGVLEVADNILPPDMQFEYLEAWLNYVGHKVLFSTWDNHAVMREETQAGSSHYARLMKQRFIYHNGIGHVDITVGKQTYKIAASHHFRGYSIYNPVHAIQRYLMMHSTDRDIGLQGDTHVPAFMEFFHADRHKLALNTGSMQLNSGYAKRFYSLTTHPEYPCVVLHPDMYKFIPFMSVSDALYYVNGYQPDTHKNVRKRSR